MSREGRTAGMSFSTRILAWLAAGIAAGLFFGELVAPLGYVADAFIKLLQMTVLPYVTVSIISSLGGLSPADAKRVGIGAGVVIGGLWLIAIAFALLLPVVFPHVESGAFFSASLVAAQPSFDFVGLYIPANPFHALANNVVPAVVLFSVVLGVAVLTLDRKAALLELLGETNRALSRATRLVTRLTPYGMFAVAANAAGTFNTQELVRVQVYLVAYGAFALLLAGWVLPGLVTALTPIRYRELLAATRDALVTAFAAGDLFIVLPALTEAAEQLLRRHYPHVTHVEALPDVLVPASFNFPHVGKLLSISFVLFAAWFADTPIPMSSYPQLALVSLLSFFGSLNAAVPFVLDLFRVPADTFQLFLATGMVNQRFGALLAGVHTIVVGVLGSAAVAGLIRVRPAQLARYIVITVLLSAATVVALRVLFATVLRPTFDGRDVVAAMAPLLPAAPVSTPAADDGDPSVFARIRQRGAVRVGLIDGRPPFSWVNEAGQWRGLDVEMANQLARDLQVGLEVRSLKGPDLEASLAPGGCDIVMGGLVATPLRATRMSFSNPYIEETLAFLVPDHLREEYATWDAIRMRQRVTVGVPDLRYFRAVVEARLPEARFQTLDETRDVFAEPLPFESVVLPAERASVITLLHPEYSVVVPAPDPIKFPVAYALASGDQRWVSFVNTWLETKRRDGTLSTLADHWIYGKEASRREPRWSVVRNVLGWTR